MVDIYYTDMHKMFDSINDNSIEELHTLGGYRLGGHKQILNNKLALELKGHDIKGSLIYVVGSDGRRENRPKLSPGELLVVLPDLENNTRRELLDCLHQLLSVHNQETTDAFPSVEQQDIINNPSSYYHTQRRVFFPTRFLDSYLMYGDQDDDIARKDRYLKELQLLKKNDRSDWKRRVLRHQQVSDQGWNMWKEEIYTHYADGAIYYDKRPGIEKGVKIGPLRALQYTLMYRIMKGIEEGRFKLEDCHKIFAGSSKVKIEFLRANGFLGLQSEEEEQFLIYAYYYFLHIHHNLQEQFVQSNKIPISLHLDNQERSEFQSVLARFNEVVCKKLMV